MTSPGPKTARGFHMVYFSLERQQPLLGQLLHPQEQPPDFLLRQMERAARPTATAKIRPTTMFPNIADPSFDHTRLRARVERTVSPLP